METISVLALHEYHRIDSRDAIADNREKVDDLLRER